MTSKAPDGAVPRPIHPACRSNPHETSHTHRISDQLARWWHVWVSTVIKLWTSTLATILLPLYYIVALHLYLVKLLFILSDVLFFFFVVVLPVIVNKDEYVKQL